MSRYILALVALAACVSPAWANKRAYGWCEAGAVHVITSGVSSSTVVQGSFPGCNVTVYQSDGVTLAQIYSTNTNVALANPFTADINGFWFFYAANGHYIVSLSNGGLPFTQNVGDVLLYDPASAAGVFILVNPSTSFVNQSVVTFDHNLNNPFPIIYCPNLMNPVVTYPTNNRAIITWPSTQTGTCIASGNTSAAFGVPGFSSDSLGNLSTPGDIASGVGGGGIGSLELDGVGGNAINITFDSTTLAGTLNIGGHTGNAILTQAGSTGLLSNKVAALSPTTVITGAAQGIYMICPWVRTSSTSSGSTGAVTLVIGWADSVGAKNTGSGGIPGLTAMNLTANNASALGCFLERVAETAGIQVQTTYTGTGTEAYDLEVSAVMVGK